MKKLLRIFSITVLSIALSLGSITVLRADSEPINYNLTNISQDYSELDEYIVIKDNQYILELPSNITLSSDLKERINITLQESNNTIVELGLIINAETKEAIHYTMDNNGLTRAYGVSSISISWNSIILKVSAGMLRSIASVITGIAVGAAVTFVAAKIAPFWPALSQTILKNGWSVQFIVGLGADLLSGKLYQSTIKHGIEVHYNFFLFHFTILKFQ